MAEAQRGTQAVKVCMAMRRWAAMCGRPPCSGGAGATALAGRWRPVARSQHPRAGCRQRAGSARRPCAQFMSPAAACACKGAPPLRRLLLTTPFRPLPLACLQVGLAQMLKVRVGHSVGGPAGARRCRLGRCWPPPLAAASLPSLSQRLLPSPTPLCCTHKHPAHHPQGGVIMDVVTPEEARIAEEAGAVAVMALERVPADIRRNGGVARMSDPQVGRLPCLDGWRWLTGWPAERARRPAALACGWPRASGGVRRAGGEGAGGHASQPSRRRAAPAAHAPTRSPATPPPHRPTDDQGDQGGGDDPGHGQGPHRPLCGGADPGGLRHRLHRRERGAWVLARRGALACGAPP